MADLIEVRGLELLVFCGVLDEEQARRQPFGIDLDLELDLSAAGASDDLELTVNYGAVTDAVAIALRDERFFLLERMATRVADIVLGFERVDAVTVVARKLRPPLPHHVATTGVRIRRTR